MSFWNEMLNLNKLWKCFAFFPAKHIENNWEFITS